MPRYQYNVFTDTLRLLKGALAFDRADPFIQTNLRAIGARSDLFHWDSLRHLDTSTLPESLKDYRPFISCQPLLFEHLPEQYGRQAYAQFIEQKPQRISLVTALLRDAGVNVCADHECWLSVEQWVYDTVQLSEKSKLKLGDRTDDMTIMSCRGEHFAHPVWQSLIVDLSLLLASHVMEHRPHAGWVFWADSGVSNAHIYNRSPWLMDTSALPLKSDDEPARESMLSNMTATVYTTLNHKIQQNPVYTDGAMSRWYLSLLNRLS